MQKVNQKRELRGTGVPLGAGSRPHAAGRRHAVAFALLYAGLSVFSIARAQDAPAPAASKDKVAVFPLGGNAPDALRERCGFALRTKLDRDGTYEVIDGPAMQDLVANVDPPVGLDTSPDVVKALASNIGAKVLIWGELSNQGEGATMKVKVLDLRKPDAQPHEIDKVIAEPTDLRFVTEQILQTLPGVKEFAHPNEDPVQMDARSKELWAKNPNLVVNGTFAQPGHWDAIYQSEKYPVKISDALPATDKVCIFRFPGGGGEKARNMLAMKLSKDCAENNGMACLSDAIKIKPNVRYRIQFRYKSDGPTLHVFVKGYTMAENIKKEKVEREIYRRQVPPSGPTNNKWVTVVDDLNPQHIAFAVDELRIDLYAYLGAGNVMFDDVQLKEVGAQTRHAVDDAIKKPVTPPEK